MKNYKQICGKGLFILLISTMSVSAQIALGKSTVTNSSVLLEFNNENKGIILPSLQSATNAANGTLIFNTTNRAIQVLQNLSWVNLTDADNGLNHTFTNTGANTGQGVIMGADTSLKPGVLTLESTTKAMVLPHVSNPHLNIKGAIAGTIVYDTSSDMLAVYNGVNWSYWK